MMPLAGHAAPAAAVAAELEQRGHEVTWVVSERHVRAVLRAGSRVLDAPPPPVVAERLASPPRGGIWESLRAFWFEVAFPLARSMRPAVEAAVGRERPDCLVVDQHALAGAFVARAQGCRWATSAATPQATSAVVDAIGGRAWLDARLAELAADAGAPATPAGDLSPALVLVYSTPELAGAGAYPSSYRFVGPPLDAAAPDGVDFPWGRLVEGARVYVTLGTTASRSDARFYGTVFEALAGEPVQAIVAAPADAAGAPPANVLVRPWVPQLDVIRCVDAVVSHGGHNTVAQALALGRPLVVSPDSFERGLVAGRVAELGAAVRVRHARLRPDELRAAVRRVLDEPAFRERAGHLGAGLRAAGGASAAADALEQVAGGA